MNVFATTLKREIKIALRMPSNIINPILFFAIAISIFPLAISPKATMLMQIAPGIIWVAAILAVLLSLHTIFYYDYENGVLEQIVLSKKPLALFVLAKISAHWLLTGLPIILISPLLANFLFLDDKSIQILMLSLLVGTPILSLIGAVGAALIVSINNSGMLLTLIIIPLYVPILIFATSAVSEAQSGFNISGHFYFLSAILVLSATLAPFISSLSLKISLE